MELHVCDCGFMDYGAALELQHQLVAEVQAGTRADTLMLVEHPPVITMGRHADNANLLLPEQSLREQGVGLYHIERGGDATYHGPGQLVGYPICDLKKNHRGSIKQFVHTLEEVFITLLREEFGIETARNPINAGVWYGDSKIVALGLAVQHAVTFHGFAFNINTRLDHFNFIVPCGLHGKSVTSLSRILGADPDFARVKQMLVKHFCQCYGYSLADIGASAV